MVEAKRVGVQIGNRWIVKEVSFTIEPGQLVSIIGPNGAGKSTLLKVIAGEKALHHGHVQINGQDIRNHPSSEIARLRGVLSQQLHLPFSMKVIEVVMLGRYPYRKEETNAQSRLIALQCLEDVGMASFENRQMETLSGGEQQRVHLARVLTQISIENSTKNRYLLLDEPTASQDITQKYRLLSLLKYLCKEKGVGVLIILHDLHLAAQYSDQILLLKNGSALAYGRPPKVLSRHRIQEVFDLPEDIYAGTFNNTIQGLVHPLSFF